MQLLAKELLKERLNALARKRSKLKDAPTLALIWVGDDHQTSIFIHRKQTVAKKLKCNFLLHHFPSASQHQLEAVLKGLNNRDDINGIVVQLPLPKTIDADTLISQIDPAKDIDNLSGHSTYISPTVAGIIALLEHHKVDPARSKTVILGAGRLVGSPLAKIFTQKKWPITVISRQARQHSTQIKPHDLLISATGVRGIVTPGMVHSKMVVIDGSGIDVDVEKIEPLVKAITPQRGAIGPLTISFLLENLISAATRKARQGK